MYNLFPNPFGKSEIQISWLLAIKLHLKVILCFRFVSGSWDKSVKLFDAETGQNIVSQFTSNIICLAYA